ncbi:MAG: putative neutral zinc metallopeptidase [Thermoleophilia bacterium]|nr:putative neutral zinc metallopeptidase [Thermoleophilia bacterium]
MLIYLLLMAPFLALSFWAQRRVSSTFEKWSAVRSSSGRTGKEVARAILDRNGLMDVEVLHTPGALTDHYDPRKRTVNLSDHVFAGNSVSAVSVAAHEVGHAIQHQKAYAPLAIRSALVPVASFGSASFMPLFMAGFVLMMIGMTQYGQFAMLAAIVLFSFGVLFQLVTLPVEFDASKRAKVQLQGLSLAPAGGDEAIGSAKVLNAAALTYVAAALAAVAQLAYFVLQMFFSRN